MFRFRKCFTNDDNSHAVIGDENITFGWQLESSKNNTIQTAYEIVLFNNEKEVIWNTGKVNSSKSLNINYNGKKLECRNEYFWNVTVWNNFSEIITSNTNSFEIGLLNSGDWTAKWIEADNKISSIKEDFNMEKIFSYHDDPSEIEDIPLDPPIVFSKEFEIDHKEIRKARIYATAHGVYEIMLNGNKVGNEYLAPGFTTYSKLQYYQTYDIRELLIDGYNKVSITVADGWYKSKLGLAGIGHQFGDKTALLAQIEVTYEDGNKVIIGTDNTFKASVGEIEYSDLFIGEKQNHNLNKKLFFDIDEKDYGYDQLKADMAEPIRCIEKIKPSRILYTPNGETVLDFGRNIAGIVEMKVNGKKGDVVQLQHSEELDLEGNFFFNIIGQNKYQTTTFVLSGENDEVFLPKFTYQGFRYVKVTGYPEKLEKDNFTAYVLSSDCKRSGILKTENEDINKLLENIYHSQESNFISVPTDCPQREKAGWTGDAQIYIPTAIFNMNIKRFMKRWLLNMRLDQLDNGQIPGLIPFIESDRMLCSGFGNISSAGWSDACIIIPWNLYVQYEDLSFLEDNYEMMKRWVDYIENRCKSNINEHSKSYEKYLWNMEFHYGDWMTPSLVNEDGSINPMKSSEKTAEQAATMYFAHSAELLSVISDILGKNYESNYYKKLSKNIKQAFIYEYVNESGIIKGDMQGLYALAIKFKIADDEMSSRFSERLLEKIRENDNKLDTGFLGTPVLLDALTESGYRKTAYELLLNEKCPSWLYMVKQGATTIWESWDAIKQDGNRNITSYNHYSLGSVEDYIVREAAGLKKIEGNEGEYLFVPDLNSPIKYCDISYESPYGKINVIWNSDNNRTQLELSVPIGVSLKVELNGDSDTLGSGMYKINI